MVFVNKMDKIGADFFKCVEMIEDRTGARAIPIALPIGSETELEGLIDLVTMEEWLWQGEDLGASWIKLRSATRSWIRLPSGAKS